MINYLRPTYQHKLLVTLHPLDLRPYYVRAKYKSLALKSIKLYILHENRTSSDVNLDTMSTS